MTILPPARQWPLARVFFVLFGAVCAAYVFSHAWVAEDAYITFRVVDNVVNGHGLRWNIDERVQVYTHPLWMLLHAAFSLIVGNIYWLTIGLSAACGLTAVILICRLAPATRWHQAVLVIAPLTLSRTFTDFVICGLENPLSFLLLSWLALEWFRPMAEFRLPRFFLLASLCLLTRIDNLVVLAPAFASVLWHHRQRVTSRAALLAWSPLVLWFGFSLFYYGFLFPNTKYAKLNTGIPTHEYLTQGWHYVSSFVFYDFFGAILILAAIVVGCARALTLLCERRVTDALQWKPMLLALGCVCHVLYVVWVGGDFMNGRFLANPVLVAVVILYTCLQSVSTARLLVVAQVVVLTAALGATVIGPSLETPYDFNAHFGINNEREYYLPTTGLFSDPAHRVRQYPAGLASSVLDEFGNSVPYVLGTIDPPGQCAPLGLPRFAANGVGLLGFCSGPDVLILDNMALTDALLARLPISDPAHWRIGHFWRATPRGYWAALSRNDATGMDPELAAYWTQLRLVTAGPLLSLDRLRTIAGFQLGLYSPTGRAH